MGRGAEGVGVEDGAARRRIPGVDALDQGGVFQVEGLGFLPQGQPRRLEHGAHAAVQQEGIVLFE